MGILNGKTAIILGAAGQDNMGQVIARRFRDAGATIIVAGRNMDALRSFAESVDGHAIACDITGKAAVERLASEAKAISGHIDIGINATGWGLVKPFLETTEDELDRMTALQLKGPFYFFQAMIGVMATSCGGRGGSIIQISSATATIMLDNHAAYMGTKAGADHILRCVANQFGHEGIRANSISPGLTATPMTADAMAVPGLEAAFVAGYPLGRIGTSDDIAAAALWLASDDCFMTGQNLQVNGGLTLRRNPGAAEIQASIIAAMAAQGG